MCNHEKKIALSLELSEKLPPQKILDRWLGEPIRSLILPTHIFKSNKKGYPVLSRAHQEFIQACFKMEVQVKIIKHAMSGYKCN